jgi:xanthine dehydrogenase FAD-binding subunit
VAHALPAADGTIALTVLDVQVEIAGPSGARSAAFTSLFAGPGRSTLKAGEELVVGFKIPLKKSGQASCFKRIMRPQGVALPILNTALWLEREGERVREIRIAVGPGAPVPFRATQAEAYLRGQPLTEETIESALLEVLAESRFRTSPQRASSDYRKHLISGLFRETLLAAWVRASKD